MREIIVLVRNEPAYCFLDTNILIHKRTFDEVDWPAVVGAQDVCLVLAPIVVKELDKHKNEGKNEWVQGRARALLSKLSPYLLNPQALSDAGVALHSHVALRYLAKEPIVDWAALGLDPGWNDDRLIATMVEFMAQHPGVEVAFAAQDTSCLAKALARGIQLVDASPIPDQSRTSPDAVETERLRRQVRELTNRLPRLQLNFLEGGQRTALATRVRPVSSSPPSVSTLDEHITDIEASERQQFEAAVSRGRELVASARLEPKELATYVRDYEQYLQDLPQSLAMEWSRQYGPTVDLDLMLDNEGTTPATDVRLSLTFPDGAFVIPRNGDTMMWDTVIRPKKPEAEWMKPPPTNPFEILANYSSLNVLPFVTHARPAGPPMPVGPLLDLIRDRHVADYRHPKLIQGGHWAMDPIRVYLLPTTGQGFEIAYTLRADEVPHIITGTLCVKFRDKLELPEN